MPTDRLASALVASMGSTLDALNVPQSLTQRRQANLPNFELPPPSALQFAPMQQQKYPPPPQHLSNNSALSLGNLLTPPSNSASDSSGASSAIFNGNTPNSAAGPVLPYTPTLFNSGNTPTFHTGYTPQPWQQGSNPLFPPRSMFSPVSGPGPLMRNNTNSPTAGEGTSLPPPPYDLNVISQYGAPYGMTSPNGASLSAQNSLMHNNMGRPQSQQSTNVSIDSLTKTQSAPQLYTNLPPAPSHGSGYPYPSSTPVSQSPHSAHANAPRNSPPLGHNHQSSQGPFIRPPYPSYSLPAMPGPAMSNINSPGAQMSMVGNIGGMSLPVGFNSGYAANPQHMYGQPRTGTPQTNAQNDRPFRCDSCPQSFHRNHDLKRHKRIHLAVKPYPCKHCDKSFSRKDALKVSSIPTSVPRSY